MTTTTEEDAGLVAAWRSIVDRPDGQPAITINRSALRPLVELAERLVEDAAGTS